LSLLAITLVQLPVLACAISSDIQEIAQATGSVIVNRPILKLGSQGSDVSELQAALKLLGYFSGTVNGFYGESTASAVSRFQQASGLNPDGIAGAATWNRLFPTALTTETPSTSFSKNPPTSSNHSTSGFPVPSSLQTQTGNSTQSHTVTAVPNSPTVANPQTTAVTLPILRQGMRGSAITLLQERLKTLGFFSGTVDGIFGEATHAAVKSAQQHFQLQPDGIVGSGTWSVLLR
jgi:peptidoglycan hydrolase-like protein with peptidoglycan-binding domain